MPPVTPDNNTGFVIDGIIFNYDDDLNEMLEKEGMANGGVQVPDRKVYRRDGKFYYVASGAAFYNGKNLNGDCTLIKQNTIYQYDDIVNRTNGNLSWRRQPERGEVIYYEGKYYVSLRERISVWEPITPGSYN